MMGRSGGGEEVKVTLKNELLSVEHYFLTTRKHFYLVISRVFLRLGLRVSLSMAPTLIVIPALYVRSPPIFVLFCLLLPRKDSRVFHSKGLSLLQARKYGSR